ncbi:MAG: response regulator [Gemmatimonadales bacterium]
MNRATGDEKMAAMAGAINELVAQRKTMQQHMRGMMESRQGMTDMMKAQECVRPGGCRSLSLSRTVCYTLRMPKSPMILVVDDEAGLRGLVARSLANEGYRVVEASDGAAALELLQSAGSDVRLIISDIRMPRMDGYELADRVVELPDPPHMVFISGYGQVGVWLPGSVFPKPFSMTALLDEVRRLLVPPKAGSVGGERRRKTPA